MAASTKRVLLLGGHGKVSLHLTPLLLAKSWDVFSVIRNPDQREEIMNLGKNQPGKVEVLIESLDDVKQESQAKKVIDQVKPNYVVWTAGAGGKGGAERTNAVDCVAAKAVGTSALTMPRQDSLTGGCGDTSNLLTQDPYSTSQPPSLRLA